MSVEGPFRIALWVILGVTMSVAVHHRRQAARSGERISRRDEGWWIAVPLRLGGVSLWLATFAYLLDFDWWSSTQLPLPAWLRWCGAALGMVGCALMYWTLTNLGKNLTDTVVTRADATLVTSGPYHYVRHPFYVAAAVLMTGTALLSADWLIGACGLWVMTLLILRTPKEELKLVEKFGEQYRAYMAATGRFIPKIRF